MIIGICGLKQSGKTTVAEYLRNDYGFDRLNFKDALIDEMKENFPDVLSELADVYNCKVDDLFLEKPPLVRYLLQNYGTEVRRKDDKDYWVRAYGKKIDSINSRRIATDDVRFLNEADAIKNAGGILIRVVNPDVVADDMHQSEIEGGEIEVDFTLVARTGNKKGLFKQMNKVLDTIKAD
tara:strand:- start:864 stop:1403 length:540 start_codon:yes stop_codon:yes gene_type:complete